VEQRARWSIAAAAVEACATGGAASTGAGAGAGGFSPSLRIWTSSMTSRCTRRERRRAGGGAALGRRRAPARTPVVRDRETGREREKMA